MNNKVIINDKQYNLENLNIFQKQNLILLSQIGKSSQKCLELLCKQCKKSKCDKLCPIYVLYKNRRQKIKLILTINK